MGDEPSPRTINLGNQKTKVVTLILSTNDTYQSTLEGEECFQHEGISDISIKLNDEFDAIKSFFEQCGLSYEEPIPLNTIGGVADAIRKLCDDAWNIDALVLCVLGVSEGNEVFSLDEKLYVDNIIQPLIESDNLSDKPKIFIFQAFHGLGKPVKTQVVSDNISIPIDADIFLADASIPFNWMGKTMATILKQIGEDKKLNMEICEIFTKVNEQIENDYYYKQFLESARKMETSSENRKQLPVTHFWSTLRDFIYFRRYHNAK